MTPLGWIHMGAALAGLASGAGVLRTRKGTTRHRQLGWAYVASMLVLNATALLIYRLFGRFGPFHVAAIFSLVTVILGTATAVRTRQHGVARRVGERARAVESHYMWMTWSYVGLLAATVSEVATRVPALRFGPGRGAVFGATVTAATLIVVAIGARAIRRHREALLAPYRRVLGC